MIKPLFSEDLLHYIRQRGQIVRAELDKAAWFTGDSLREAVSTETDWRKRLKLWQLSYRICDRLYEAALFDWMHADPYFLADFSKVFTPIEDQMWQEIRACGLCLWPQLPVGRFFVDFGNPLLKIAVECDGKQFHDPAKDARRDAELKAMGWTVYRASGFLCNRILPEPRHYDFESEEEWESAMREWEQKTLGGIVREIRARVQEYDACRFEDEQLAYAEVI